MRSPGLYLHVPYCASKCPYCDFYSEVGMEGVQSWLQAVAAEADRYREQFEPFGTFYLGVGRRRCSRRVISRSSWVC